MCSRMLIHQRLSVIALICASVSSLRPRLSVKRLAAAPRRIFSAHAICFSDPKTNAENFTPRVISSSRFSFSARSSSSSLRLALNQQLGQRVIFLCAQSSYFPAAFRVRHVFRCSNRRPHFSHTIQTCAVADISTPPISIFSLRQDATMA